MTTIATKIGMAYSSIRLRIKKIENLLGRKLPRNDGRKKVVIDEIDEQIIEYLGQGLTIREIEAILNRVDISYRIDMIERMYGKRLQRRGIHKKDSNYEIDNIISKGLADGKTQTAIAEELGISQQRVSQRKKKIVQRDNQKLAKMIVNLIFTKHATIEQIRLIGDYYGIDVEEVLNSLDEQER